MAWRSGSLSRSLLSTIRSTGIRRSSSSTSSLLRPPPPPRSLCCPLFTAPRAIAGEFGLDQSLTPMHNALATVRFASHTSLNTRAFCELSQGS